MSQIAILMAAYLPTRQHVDWLGEAVATIYASTFTDWELVIVLDGGSLPIAPSNDPKIVILQADRRVGPGAARNAAVRESSAEYLMALDADDRLKPDALQKLYDARCETGVIYGDLEWTGERRGVQRLNEFNIDELKALNGPMPVVALHSRSAWQKVGGWSENLDGLEDIEYWIRLAAAGICGKRIDAVTFEYRKHSASRQSKLEADGKQELRVVADRIRQKHTLLWSKLTMAGCSTCPGGGAGPAPTISVPEGLGPDALDVKYTGPKLGSFFLHSPSVAGLRYRIDMTGSWLRIDRRDAEWLLNDYREGGQIVFLLPPPPAPPVVVPATPLDAAPPDITALSVPQARIVIERIRDRDDLRILKAMELAQAPVQRKGVLQAIDARLAQLEQTA